MEILGLVIAIIFGLGALGTFGYSIYLSVKTNKDNKIIAQNYGVIGKKQAIIAAIFAGLFLICMIGLRLTTNQDLKALEVIALVFGGLFFITMAKSLIRKLINGFLEQFVLPLLY